MRIRNITIRQWRHFENIELQLDEGTGLICLVGANGTGKSHLLELIGACAPKLGLSPGTETTRGDPFSDPHDFSLQFHLAEGVSDTIDQAITAEALFPRWDRTLTIQSRKDADKAVMAITAGGIVDQAQSTKFAKVVVKALQQSKDVHFLSLDADRAYPKKTIDSGAAAQAYEVDWESQEYMRGRSYRATTTLYDEWIKYFLARENQFSTSLTKTIRGAKRTQRSDLAKDVQAALPQVTFTDAERANGNEAGDLLLLSFTDPFSGFKEAVLKVLPHVKFAGVDSGKRTLLFDTTGLELNFSQLSGGEREITFLIGQMDRFRLRWGLFLLDEPELHLNADLIRTWVNYLTSTVETGQIWLATHSLEAVEAAGQHATFVLERNEETRKVNRLARLDTRPVLSALSRAVGTPAFSISQLVFVFVEGEESVGERERFRKLAGLPQNIRFMACGSGNEVLHRVADIKALADEAQTPIRIGGIIDRDFRSENDAAAISRDRGAFVLPVHEVENVFLHPRTLTLLLAQNGRGHLAPLDLIREASDARAGSWIFQRTWATPNAKSFPDIPHIAKDRAKALNWAQIDANREATLQGIVDASGFAAEDQRMLKDVLQISVTSYGRKRARDELWKFCEGKQVLNDVGRAAGFSAAQAMIDASFAAWSRPDVQIPEEVLALRAYLARL